MLDQLAADLLHIICETLQPLPVQFVQACGATDKRKPKTGSHIRQSADQGNGRTHLVFVVRTEFRAQDEPAETRCANACVKREALFRCAIERLLSRHRTQRSFHSLQSLFDTLRKVGGRMHSAEHILDGDCDDHTDGYHPGRPECVLHPQIYAQLMLVPERNGACNHEAEGDSHANIRYDAQKVKGKKQTEENPQEMRHGVSDQEPHT